MSSNWNAASEILNSKEMRLNMVEDLKTKSNMAKLINKSVLNAMEVVPRQLFIDEQRLPGSGSDWLAKPAREI